MSERIITQEERDILYNGGKGRGFSEVLPLTESVNSTFGDTGYTIVPKRDADGKLIAVKGDAETKENESEEK